MKVTINGIQLACEGWEGKAPAIVLLHGFGLNRSVWREIAKKHLRDQQVILPDLRGHGESDAPQGTYSMPLLAQDLNGVLAAVGVDRAVVCGHSMGGYVALAFAEQFPHMLAGLGLITTNAGADSDEKRAGRYALIEQVRTKGAPAVAESLAPRLSFDSAVITQAYDMIKRTDPNGLIGSLAGMAEREDRTNLLPEINVPALVAAGEVDQITDLGASKAMAAALPKGEILSLPGAGHMPMVEVPDTLGKGLRVLIDRSKREG